MFDTTTLADPIDIAVGARIRMRRKVLQVSQSALANTLGITFQQVQKYERGTNRVSASVLVKIARRLDCTVAELVGEDVKNPVEPDYLVKLSKPGARDLLDAFDNIEDAEQRRNLINLAQGLGAKPNPKPQVPALKAA